MKSNACAVDIDLLERHDRAGPRYTSYPTAPQFSDAFDAGALRDAIVASNGDPIPRRLSFYVHVPFCSSPCFYCGCNRVITRDPTRGDAYLAHLSREIELVSGLLDPDREAAQLHFGGGTPNFLSHTQLVECARDILRRFPASAPGETEISIELDPRFAQPSDVAALGRGGFNRASLGVQDFEPSVQQAVNRVQGIDATRAVVDACRDSGFRSVNIDLIYGLPNQTVLGFERTIDAVLAIRPDRLAIYSYAHMPSLFRAQRRIDATALPAAADKLALLVLAIRRLTEAGYVYIGMDHFALPEDALATAQACGHLHRNFMGYTTHADCDLIGVGVSAISHIGNTFSQNPRDLPGWERALADQRLPVFRGLHLSDDDQLRADLIQGLMCQGEVPVHTLERRYGIAFDDYFQSCLERLRPLEADGLVERDHVGLRATRTGRLFLRNIAMCFDAYLDQPNVVVGPHVGRVRQP